MLRLLLLSAAVGSSLVFAEPLFLQSWDTLVPDTNLQRDGRDTWRWPDIGRNTTARCQQFPKDMTAYPTVTLWMHVAEPTDSRLALIFASENPETDGSDYYIATLCTEYSGWRQFRVARTLLSAVRSPLGWDRISAVFLSSNWHHRLDPATDVHLHDIGLSTEPVPGVDRPAGELLANRSFEVDGDGDGRPDGWSTSAFGGDATVELDGETAHSGTFSVRITGTPTSRAGASCGFGPERTQIDQLYLLRAYVRVEGTSASGLRTSARVTSVSREGKVLKSDYRLCVLGPHDWRAYEWLVRLPADTHRFNLVLFHHGDGTAWWDDVSLRGYQPTPGLTPADDATVPDSRPTLAWAPVGRKAVIELAESGALGSDRTWRFETSGTSFAVPEGLEAGRLYEWRAFVETEDGDPFVVVAPAGEDAEPRWCRFYAGTWQQRTATLHSRYDSQRRSYAKLKQFADRNGMWDDFSLLGSVLAEVSQLADEEPENSGVRLAELDKAWQELDYTLPWWEKVLLDDAELFGALDLELPGLAGVKTAVDTQDYAQARQALCAYYRDRKLPDYYGKHMRRPSRNPARTTDTKAEQLLTHKVAIHSYREPTYDLGPEFDWHVFPIIDVEWPTKIHRHFHWPQLASAYWRTGNEAYAEELVQQLFDWVKDNPMERWDRLRYRWAWSTLNATIRIYVSWIDSWLQIRNSEAWRADAQFVFLTALREHGRFLMTHAAKQGNWVVAEARGLVELGIMFPEFREAEAWRAEGYRRLLQELHDQVLADGVHIERTPGYHSMVIGCFMQPVQLGLLNGLDIEGKDTFVAKLEQMHEYYLYGSKPNLRMPQIGDAGRMQVAQLMRRGWDMFRREDMRCLATEGQEGVLPVHRSYAFRAAGQYVSRSAWCDPLALWSIIDWGGHVGHCHEDTGHTSVYAYGADLLIDTGRYSYAWPMRAPFYQTVGHNTVLVDRKSQKRRDALESTWISCAQFDVFRGLTDNSEPLMHERTLVFRQPSAAGPGYWLVLDRLSGEGRHRLDQRWHASEKLTARVQANSVMLSTKEDEQPQPSLVLAAMPQSGLETAVVPGAVSYAWYKKIPVDVAQFTLECDVPAVLATVLYPVPSGASVPEIAIERVAVGIDGTAASEREALCVRARIQDGDVLYEDVWLVKQRAEGTIDGAGMATDGHVAMVRRVGGAVQSWLCANGGRLSVGDNVLFQADERVEAIALTESASGSTLTCSAAKSLRVRAAPDVVLNGRALDRERPDGMLALDGVVPVAVPTVPRGVGPARFEIEPPPPPTPASSFLKMLPREATPSGETVAIEAEDFVGEGGGKVELSEGKTGARGKAFLHWDNAGHWLEWQANVPADGTYELFIRACTGQDRALRKLTVNGETLEACKAMEFAGTGGYSNGTDDWRTFAVSDKGGHFKLSAGPVTLRLENVDGNSLNLDWLALVGQ